VLGSTKQWYDARAIIQQCQFELVGSVDEKFCVSFIIQAAELEHGCKQHQNILFVPALATVLEHVGL